MHTFTAPPDLQVHQPTTSSTALGALTGLTSLIGSPTSERMLSDEHLADAFARGARRPEWVWLGERDGATVARVAAWGAPGADLPWIIDLVHAGGTAQPYAALAATLRRAVDDLRLAGAQTVELIIFVSPTWRTDESQVVSDLLAASSAAGFDLLVARLHFEWYTADHDGNVEPSRCGLRFESITGTDDPRLVEAYRRSLTGSLDAHTVRDLRTRDGAELAAAEVADMANYAAPVSAWRVAYNADDDLVGLVTTGWRARRGVIGYVGVVPEHRGRGHAAALLAEGTRIATQAGCELVVGETDEENLPMAQAFRTAGYRHTEGRIDLATRGS